MGENTILAKYVAEAMKPTPETSIIGQGDEEYEMRKKELSISTSKFISQLFDMSEVEKVITYDETDNTQQSATSNELLTQTITKIMESYVNAAFDLAFERKYEMTHLDEDDVHYQSITGEENAESDSQSHLYSFRNNTCSVEVRKDTAFIIDKNDEENNLETSSTVCDEAKIQILEEPTETNVYETCPALTRHEEMKDENVTFFENAYLTMNRDYEQDFDGDGAAYVIEDPKGQKMQEVDLLTANTSETNFASNIESKREPKKDNLLATTSGVSAVSGSRKSKSSIIGRCRTQGARLLACLRGWWRRKTPGRRKDPRAPGSLRGICPISPDARRRALTMLNQRYTFSPIPPRSAGVWKFNTINESYLSAQRWNKYVFGNKPDEFSN